jgi:metal-responsive CopG/Arc/MetJ family transcriptional regulator
MTIADRLRFDVQMPEELADQLDSISDSTGLTRAEIFRRAVALYKDAKNIEKNKGKVLFKDAQGEMYHVVGL